MGKSFETPTSGFTTGKQTKVNAYRYQLSLLVQVVRKTQMAADDAHEPVEAKPETDGTEDVRVGSRDDV